MENAQSDTSTKKKSTFRKKNRGSKIREGPNSALAELLSSQRAKLRLSQQEIADRVGSNTNNMNICWYETGARPVPYNKIVKVAKAYEITPIEILKRDPRLKDSFEPMEQLPSLPSINLQTRVTREDLEFFLELYKGLLEPMTLHQLLDLFRLRHPEPSP
jgi:transcriptional regulator with XRE-family HTH domain